MLPPSSQRKSSQREDFELGLHASHHLKNNPPKGRIPKRWDKNPVQEILPEGRIISRVLLIEGYLHVSTFYSGRCMEVCGRVCEGAQRCVEVHRGAWRCVQGCTRWCTSHEGPGRQKSGSMWVCTGAQKL